VIIIRKYEVVVPQRAEESRPKPGKYLLGGKEKLISLGPLLLG